MKNLICITMMLVVIMLSFQTTQAQGKLNATFRPSFNFPIEDLGAVELKRGGGFEVTFAYQFVPAWAAYAGWGYNRFNPESSVSVAHFEETGYRVGLQRKQQFGKNTNLNALFSAGIVLNHIETENDQGDILNDSGHGVGWEGDIGLSIPLNERWQIVPGIRYHSLSRKIEMGGVEESVDLKYLSIGVAVSWTLKQ